MLIKRPPRRYLRWTAQELRMRRKGAIEAPRHLLRQRPTRQVKFLPDNNRALQEVDHHHPLHPKGEPKTNNKGSRPTVAGRKRSTSSSKHQPYLRVELSAPSLIP